MPTYVLNTHAHTCPPISETLCVCVYVCAVSIKLKLVGINGRHVTKGGWGKGVVRKMECKLYGGYMSACNNSINMCRWGWEVLFAQSFSMRESVYKCVCVCSIEGQLKVLLYICMYINTG